MTAHHFTVDVEEYFHPTALAPHYPIAAWDSLERRSPKIMDRLLAFLADRDVLGTFFVVGWLAEREPEMVRRIAAAGHEVASHGYEHELVARLGQEGFRSSVRRSKEVLERLSGTEIIGYRAPSFSIVPGLEWAFDTLIDEGYRYDASLFPVSQHPTYGYPGASRDPFLIERPGGTLAEFPATTAKWLRQTLPAAGGAYFRILPLALIRAGLRQAECRGSPGMFYIHPWEMDDWVPDVKAPRLQKLRTFAGMKGTWRRMDRMLREFRFAPVRTALEQMAQPDARRTEKG